MKNGQVTVTTVEPVSKVERLQAMVVVHRHAAISLATQGERFQAACARRRMQEAQEALNAETAKSQRMLRPSGFGQFGGAQAL